MELAYHRKCIDDAYNIARFAEEHQRILDRNTIRVFAGFMKEALEHKEFRQGPGMERMRELSAILQEHYDFQRRDPTISSLVH